MKTDLFIQTKNQVQNDNNKVTPQPQYNQLPPEWTERFRALPKTFKSQIRYILRAGGPSPEDLEIYNSLKTLIIIRRRQLALKGEGAGSLGDNRVTGTSMPLPQFNRITPGAGTSTNMPGVNRVAPVVRPVPIIPAREEDVPDFSQYEDPDEEDNGDSNFRGLPTNAYLDPEPIVTFNHEGLALTDSPLNRELDNAAAATPSPLQPNSHYSFPDIETPSPMSQ